MNVPAADFCVRREEMPGRAATSTINATTLVVGGDGPVPARLSDPVNDSGCFVHIQGACLDCLPVIGFGATAVLGRVLEKAAKCQRTVTGKCTHK